MSSPILFLSAVLSPLVPCLALRPRLLSYLDLNTKCPYTKQQ